MLSSSNLSPEGTPKLSIPLPTLHAIVATVEADSTLLHAEALIGGASAQVILLHVRHPDGSAQKYVLRVHSEQDRERNPHIAQHEFTLLQTLYDLSLPVARSGFLDLSGQLHPTPYLIVHYIEGATDFSPRDLTDFIDQSATALAKVHRAKLPPEKSTALDFLSNRSNHALWWIGITTDSTHPAAPAAWDTVRVCPQQAP